MSRLYGVFYGLHNKSNTSGDEMNRRYYSHQVHPQPIEYKFDPRPEETRHVKFPAYVNKSNYNTINSNSNMNYLTNTSKGTFSGFSANIDHETILRNQHFALQKSDRACYVPDSNSMLYNPTFKNNKDSPDDHKLLFQSYTPISSSVKHVPGNIGSDLFYNHTRTQLNN